MRSQETPMRHESGLEKESGQAQPRKNGEGPK